MRKYALPHHQQHMGEVKSGDKPSVHKQVTDKQNAIHPSSGKFLSLKKDKQIHI